MQLSARNQLRGMVKSLDLGDVMAEVVVDLGDGKEVVAEITRRSAERLELKEGQKVVAVIKATEVIIAKG